MYRTWSIEHQSEPNHEGKMCSEKNNINSASSNVNQPYLLIFIRQHVFVVEALHLNIHYESLKCELMCLDFIEKLNGCVVLDAWCIMHLSVCLWLSVLWFFISYNLSPQPISVLVCQIAQPSDTSFLCMSGWLASCILSPSRRCRAQPMRLFIYLFEFSLKWMVQFSPFSTEFSPLTLRIPHGYTTEFSPRQWTSLVPLSYLRELVFSDSDGFVLIQVCVPRISKLIWMVQY